MLRFSKLAVLVGKVPSTGNALTGIRSPLPLTSIDGDSLDEIIGTIVHCNVTGGKRRGLRGGLLWYCEPVGAMRNRAVDSGASCFPALIRRACHMFSESIL